MSNVIFSAKRGKDGYLVALVLKPESRTPIEETNGGYENLNELNAVITGKYKGAIFMTKERFAWEAAQRLVHTPEMLALMAQYNELLGTDITPYFVYGSAHRPTNTMFYGLENAVHMQVDKATTGFYTYIAIPEMLDAKLVDRYELQFVSRAAY